MPVYHIEFGYQYNDSPSVHRRSASVQIPYAEGGNCSETRALREVREFMRGNSDVDPSSIFIYDIREN